MTALLLRGTAARASADPILWAMRADARVEIGKALTFALTAENQPFRQFWQVAERQGAIIGVGHAILLPVPPIYAGDFGPPGLIMADSFIPPEAPDGTARAVLEELEVALRQAGAKILLAAQVGDDAMGRAAQASGYSPLTLYLSRDDLGDVMPSAQVRRATEDDLPGIVSRSARHRDALHRIDPFWKPHPDADARFGAWMARSLTLSDREMFVTGDPANVQGYVIAQPTTRLHFPPAHEIAGIGVIDDFHHAALEDIADLPQHPDAAVDFLRAAEASLAARGAGAAFVVCPAGWTSKGRAAAQRGLRDGDDLVDPALSVTSPIPAKAALLDNSPAL